jgi:small subunit ribosomal protein S20
MPITRSAQKALRGSAKKRVFNTRRKDAMKIDIKKMKSLIAEKKIKEAKEFLPKVYKSIDKAAKRGVIKDNNAARKKSRVSAMIKKNS